MRKSFFILPFLTLLFLFTSCDKEEVVCTEQYVMVTIEVTDQEGKPVVLDEFYTVRNKTGNKIETIGGSSPSEGRYEVIGDNFREPLEGKTETFTFHGKFGSFTFKEEFKVSADKCHIAKVSGKDRVLVNAGSGN